MADIRIKVVPGECSNEDAYNILLNYVTNKEIWSGYGFYPYDLNAAIIQFYQSLSNSEHQNPRQLWHFVITFQRAWNTNTLFQIANNIAWMFVPNYQIVFAVDTVGTPHLHFAVNAVSWHPGYSVLSDETMKKYMYQIHNYLHTLYPNLYIALILPDNLK